MIEEKLLYKSLDSNHINEMIQEKLLYIINRMRLPSFYLFIIFLFLFLFFFVSKTTFIGRDYLLFYLFTSHFVFLNSKLFIACKMPYVCTCVAPINTSQMQAQEVGGEHDRSRVGCY